MGQVNRVRHLVKIIPDPAPGTVYGVSSSPVPLMWAGFHMSVTITTASTLLNARSNSMIQSITVTGLLDSGASGTCIDAQIADFLNLSAVGVSPSHTAGGVIQTPDYAVDIHFPGTELSPCVDLLVGSCNLPFALSPQSRDFLSERNIGMLIGRDIMSRWNIVWNGPTSSVFISD